MAGSALLRLAWLTALLAVRFNGGPAQPTCREFRKDCKWPLQGTITFHGCLNRTSAPKSKVTAVENLVNLTLLRKLSDPEPCALRCYREDMSWASLNRTHCFCFPASNDFRKFVDKLLTPAEECLRCLDKKGKDKGFSCGSDDTLVFYSISTAYSPTIVDNMAQITVVGQPPETRTTHVYDNRTRTLTCSLHPPLKNDQMVLRYDWFKNEQRITTQNGCTNTLTINTQSSADEAVGNYTCYVTVDRPKVCSHALGCQKSLEPIVVLRHSAKPAVCLSPSLANATPRQTANSRPRSWTEGDTVVFTCNNSNTVVELTCTPSGVWSKSHTCALPEKPITCLSPTLVNATLRWSSAAAIHAQTWLEGDVAVFDCAESDKVITLVCMRTGSWSVSDVCQPTAEEPSERVCRRSSGFSTISTIGMIISGTIGGIIIGLIIGWWPNRRWTKTSNSKHSSRLERSEECSGHQHRGLCLPDIDMTVNRAYGLLPSPLGQQP